MAAFGMKQTTRDKRCVSLLVVTSGLLVAHLCYGFDANSIYATGVATFSDTMNYLTAIKNIVVDGWWWSSTHVSFPYGLDIRGFPLDGNFNFLLFKIISFFNDNPFAILAYGLGISIILCACFSYFFMRLCGSNSFWAFCFALIFAFCPTVYYRSVHLFHSQPLFVPITCGIAYLIYTGKGVSLKRCYRYTMFGLSFLIGFGYIYGTFFTYFFWGIAFIRQIFQQDSRRVLIFAGKCLACLTIGTLLNAAPTIIAYRDNPEVAQKMLHFKVAAEADPRGLHIRTLFRPVPTWRLGYSEVEKIYLRAQYDSDKGEQLQGRLGIVASLGLITVLLGLFFRREGKAKNCPIYTACGCIGILCVAALLFGVPSGFGSMLNMFSPQIRSYNRFTPYIGFLSLLFIAICGTWISHAVKKYLIWKIFVGITVVFLTYFAIFIDQKPYKGALFVEQDPLVSSVQSMLEEFNPFLTADAKILFLPVMEYPEVNKRYLGQMKIMNDAIPYLLNTGYKWSIMPFEPQAVKNLGNLLVLRGKELANQIRNLGYDAVLYDTSANTDFYLDVVMSLTNSAKNTYISSNLRYMLFTDFTDEELHIFDKERFFATSEFGRYHLLPRVPLHSLQFKVGSGGFLYLTKGWSSTESEGTWSDGKQSFMTLPIARGVKHLVFIGRSYGRQRYEIYYGDTLLTSGEVEGGTIDVPVPDNLTYDTEGVAFYSLKIVWPNAVSPASQLKSRDTRELAFYLREIKFQK